VGEASRLLSVPHLGAGHGVGLGVVPLVEGNTGVVGAVDTGNLGLGRGVASAGRGNLQLEALHVELSLADVALVETDVLNADEVLASRDVLLDGPLKISSQYVSHMHLERLQLTSRRSFCQLSQAVSTPGWLGFLRPLSMTLTQSPLPS
jgi:hypothetical protein